MTEGHEAIMAAWMEAETSFPGKSIEFITAIVCDEAKCNPSDVSNALAASFEESEAKP